MAGWLGLAGFVVLIVSWWLLSASVFAEAFILPRLAATAPAFADALLGISYGHTGGVDLVLVGHHHNYERFAPQMPRGVADNTYGVRQIIVGTGGVSVSTPKFRRANSEVLNSTTYGVLRLTLDVGQYYWKFLPAGTATWTDEPDGQAAVPCHDKPPKRPDQMLIAIPAVGFHQNGQVQIGIHAAKIKTAHSARTRHTQ